MNLAMNENVAAYGQDGRKFENGTLTYGTKGHKKGEEIPSFDMEARHIIEALRSGIPSRAVGAYFASARPRIMREIAERMEVVGKTRKSNGMIVSGKYGEGKTHLLNTVFTMAHANNMVVSYLSLSKETPMDKLYLVYQKIISNTYLPQHQQPGFLHVLENMTPNSPLASEMIAYSAKQLETDKLYYLLRAYLNTEDAEEKFLLQADLEGDFMGNAPLKKIYRRIFNHPVKYNVNFSKTKHCQDYFSFMSHLFTQMGYQGWVILIDEAELIGRLGKKARLNAYSNMARFLVPETGLESTFTMFALSSSYTEDVIEGKHDYENLAELFPENQEPAHTVLELLRKAPQLHPLTRNEFREILEKLQDFHGKAYCWEPQISIEVMEKITQAGGYLLRTKIRAAIEYLDQVYQYGEGSDAVFTGLTEESYTEDIPSLENLVKE